MNLSNNPWRDARGKQGKMKGLIVPLSFSKFLRRFYLQLYNGSCWCCSASLPLPRLVLPGLSSSPVSSPPAIRPHHKYIKGIFNIITLDSTLISVRVVLQIVLVPWTSVLEGMHVRGECTLKLFLLLCFNVCMLVFDVKSSPIYVKNWRGGDCCRSMIEHQPSLARVRATPFVYKICNLSRDSFILPSCTP